jgi:hypothetical protein
VQAVLDPAQQAGRTRALVLERDGDLALFGESLVEPRLQTVTSGQDQVVRRM